MRCPLPSLIAAMLLCAPGARAQSPGLMHALFQDHAVLQRDRPIHVWGQAPAGDFVIASIAGNSVRVQADATGAWSAELPALGPGGPYVLTAQTNHGALQSVRDVLIGDVFLCSGQSNMELSVLRVGDSRAEIADSANDSLRMLTVAEAAAPAPLSTFATPVEWQVAGPQTVPGWSATCFFFARELQKSTHVPIGMLHSSWGGSNIRAWMSAAALHADGGYEPGLRLLALYAREPASAQQQFAAQWEQWWRAKTGEHAGSEPWSERAAPASAGWQRAPAALGNWRYWGMPELADLRGAIWYRTRCTLTAAQAAGARTLTLGAINQIDQAWVNGHPLGNTFGYGTDRSYPLPAGALHAGSNLLVVNVVSTWGGGGLLSGGAPRALHLADGSSIPIDGPWEYRVVPTALGYPPHAPWESVGGLTAIYNAMIAPLEPYGIRAAVWYQGESNTGEAGSYQRLLAELMADWRRPFGRELPFLIVQLPNFGPPPFTPEESGWAEVREAQRLAAANDAHAGLAVTIDIGDPYNLHPTNKQDVGRRLARAARRVIYGESISPSGPVALSAVRAAEGVVVQFTDVDSELIAYSHESPIGFELCEDPRGSCRYADARLDGSRVLLQLPGNMSPTRVRYCWADCPICTLFDRTPLPAGPFELRIRP